MATVLNVDLRTKFKVMSQLILHISPGPGRTAKILSSPDCRGAQQPGRRCERRDGRELRRALARTRFRDSVHGGNACWR